jgi:basic amino acid/polyamine antiporter, APA family
MSYVDGLGGRPGSDILRPLTLATQAPPGLERRLGLAAVAAVVVGDMLGSGVFFTPGELAAVAEAPWQVYFFWGVCGTITLCGALTLAELTSLLPQAGASYHIIREGFGPFFAFLKIWIEMWVSGPGSVAGVAILFGELVVRLLGSSAFVPAAAWGTAAIVAFTAVNLLGVQWGARTQITLTAVKILGLGALILGSLLLADPAASAGATEAGAAGGSLLGFVRLVGLGVAAVLFTYDGWVDVTHVAGEVARPRRDFPLGLGLGVLFVTLLYLVVNYAYLRVVPLAAMRAAPTAVASTVATTAFGPTGGRLVSLLLLVSILGALGGLILTLPRLFFAGASAYVGPTEGTGLHGFFRALSWVSARRVPAGAALFSAALSVAALVFFNEFGKIVAFFVVPVHFVNILMVASVFRLRRRPAPPDAYRTPGYPLVPAVYVVVLALFLASALVYNPLDTLIGVAMTATAIPVFLVMRRRARA